MSFPAPPTLPAARVLDGFGRAAIRPNNPHVGTELLSSFYLRFSYPPAQDNEIMAIGISPEQPTLSQATIIFQDEAPTTDKDEYYYNIAFLDSAYAGVSTATFGREVCIRSCTQTLNRPAGDNVFVLRGFYAYYRDGDHNIEEIEIAEHDGTLTMTFKDDTGGGHSVVWEVNYAYVPRSTFRDVGETSGQAKGAAQQSITPGTAVVRGFHYKFLNGDHPLREIGVWIPGDGRLETFFGDDNGGDEFQYKVLWAVIPQTLSVYTKR